jgi:hypothetical protein
MGSFLLAMSACRSSFGTKTQVFFYGPIETLFLSAMQKVPENSNVFTGSTTFLRETLFFRQIILTEFDTSTIDCRG